MRRAPRSRTGDAVAVERRVDGESREELPQVGAGERGLGDERAHVDERVARPAFPQPESGYVDRSRDPEDGRRVLFTATGPGLAIAVKVRARMEGWFDSQLAALEPDERPRSSR